MLLIFWKNPHRPRGPRLRIKILLESNPLSIINVYITITVLILLLLFLIIVQILSSRPDRNSVRPIRAQGTRKMLCLPGPRSLFRSRLRTDFPPRMSDRRWRSNRRSRSALHSYRRSVPPSSLLTHPCPALPSPARSGRVRFQSGRGRKLQMPLIVAPDSWTLRLPCGQWVSEWVSDRALASSVLSQTDACFVLGHLLFSLVLLQTTGAKGTIIFSTKETSTKEMSVRWVVCCDCRC